MTEISVSYHHQHRPPDLSSTLEQTASSLEIPSPLPNPMPHHVVDETLFTLSFGGVEFTLTPSHKNVDSAVATSSTSDGNGDMMLSVSKICNGEVLINLKNFIGTLRIKNHNASVAASTVNPEVSNVNEDNTLEVPLPAEADDAVAPNPVEDTPSPHAKSCSETNAAESLKQRKGQQKLNFFDKRGDQEGKKNQVDTSC